MNCKPQLLRSFMAALRSPTKKLGIPTHGRVVNGGDEASRGTNRVEGACEMRHLQLISATPAYDIDPFLSIY